VEKWQIIANENEKTVRNFKKRKCSKKEIVPKRKNPKKSEKLIKNICNFFLGN